MTQTPSGRPLLPGQTLGILGSGQLGRMTAMAAKHMGYRVAVLGPGAADPAAQVADEAIVSALDDVDAGLRLAEGAGVVTLEFENVSKETAKAIARKGVLRPRPEVLEIAQHRLREKESLRDLGIPTASFVPVRSVDDLDRALSQLGTPFLLKTVQGGYDGKGQSVVEIPGDARAAFERLGAGSVELIAEGYVSFAKELSVVVARGADGSSAAFPVAENEHRNNILHRTIAPARISSDLQASAQRLATEIAEGLDVVGLVAVELFYLAPDTLLVNEIAPRPHNSGHYTLDACVTSQFEQHVRSVCGLPLGDVRRHSAAVMINILGEHVGDVFNRYERLLRDPGLKIHLYGKAEARPGRKMGHLTALGTDLDEAIDRAERACRELSLPFALDDERKD